MHHSSKKKEKQMEWERITDMSPSELEKEYLEHAIEAWDKAWEILHTEDGWKHEKGKCLEKGIVHSHHFENIGKLFKIEAYMDASKELVFEELVTKCDKQPEWNATLQEGRTLQRINDNTDVYYSLTSPAAGGIVSSRDFVSLRHWKTKDDIILSAGCAVKHPDMPPVKKYVRGENRPGGWIFKPIPGEPDRSIFCWIMNTDIKGWIPHSIVDHALSSTLMEFVRHVQERINLIKAQS